MTKTIVDLVEDAVKDIRSSNGKPYYSHNTWPEEADRLSQINKIATTEDMKFERVFLREPIRESYNDREKQYESTITIYIIGRTKQTINSEQRHKNEMPALRTIETNLLKSLKVNNVRFTDYEREEVKYAEFNINTAVNFIELELPVYYKLNCLT